MATIRYTHGYNLLYKLSVGVGGIIVAGCAFELASPVIDPIDDFLLAQGLKWLEAILGFAVLLSAYAASVALLVKTILPLWLPSYLHVRLSLGTKLSPKDAASLSFLFEGTLNGSWYPCRFVKKIDPEFRLEALMFFANRVAAEHGLVQPFPQAAPQPEQKPQGKASAGGDNHAANENKWSSQSNTSSAGSRREADQPGSEEARIGSDNAHNTAQQPAETAYERELKACLKVLGLSGSPDFSAVKQAYRRKISQYHPDRFVGERPEVMKYGEEMAKLINGAYAFLQAHYEVVSA